MKVLLHCPTSTGGIAEYVHYQAQALVNRRHQVMVLCPPDFLQGRVLPYPTAYVYGSLYQPYAGSSLFSHGFNLLRKLYFYLFNQWRLAFEIIKRKPDIVLLDSYAEYLSPLWVWPHILLFKIFHVTYVANLHDPVRDFVVGPKWWHDLSVMLAYLPIRICSVHHLPDESSAIPNHIYTIQVPHGVYALSESNPALVHSLCDLNIPDDLVVFLSFGFIRDNKNLDLLIQALSSVPQAFILVLGSEQSSRNKPLSFYKNLAQQLGVDDRVRFNENFVPDEMILSYFRLAHVIAITYDSTFVSQSGVLNLAVRSRRRVLASSGDGPLKRSVLEFRLGEFVEPNSLNALVLGMQKLTQQILLNLKLPVPDWDGYEKYASWDTNVERIVDAVSSLRFADQSKTVNDRFPRAFSSLNK